MGGTKPHNVLYDNHKGGVNVVAKRETKFEFLVRNSRENEDKIESIFGNNGYLLIHQSSPPAPH